MRFQPTALEGVFLIDVEPARDERGFFARTFCAREFAARGLSPAVAQCNVSYNRRAGTVRGMHFQRPPAAEAKLVRCIRGAIHDVVADLRPDSPTFGRHLGVELRAEDRRALYVPPGLAHGFQTLADETEVLYQMDAFHAPGHDGGFRHDDPTFAIRWPLPVTVISDKDLGWPPFDLQRSPFRRAVPA